MNRLTGDEVLNWFGEDDLEEVAEYIASILCNIENGYTKATDLINEIKEYQEEE
jgi:hypothetical protein